MLPVYGICCEPQCASGGCLSLFNSTVPVLTSPEPASKCIFAIDLFLVPALSFSQFKEKMETFQVAASAFENDSV
jgi:hypothetical protein